MRALFVVLFLSGCNVDSGVTVFKCTEKQWERAEVESTYCINNTSHFSTDCMRMAKQAHCSFVVRSPISEIPEGEDD